MKPEEENMQTFFGAVLATLLFSSAIAFAQSVEDIDCDCTADLEHFHYPIVFHREIPPADAYEMIESISPGEVYDEDVDGMVAACVIYTTAVEYPSWPIPVDEYGTQMIMLDDGMTFLAAGVIVDLIYDTNCSMDALMSDATS